MSIRVSTGNRMVMQLRWAPCHASEEVKCVVGPKMSSGSWQGWKSWEQRLAATTPVRVEGEDENKWKSFTGIGKTM